MTLYIPHLKRVQAERFERGKRIPSKVLEVFVEANPSNPRTEFDHVGHMLCYHPRYCLGDDLECRPEVGTWESLKELLKSEHGAVAVLPLYLYDHSGLAMSTSPSPARGTPCK